MEEQVLPEVINKMYRLLTYFCFQYEIGKDGKLYPNIIVDELEESDDDFSSDEEDDFFSDEDFVANECDVVDGEAEEGFWGNELLENEATGAVNDGEADEVTNAESEDVTDGKSFEATGNANTSGNANISASTANSSTERIYNPLITYGFMAQYNKMYKAKTKADTKSGIFS